MLRRQWIAALVGFMIVGGLFAWLGQWQLSRSIDFAPPVAGASELEQPIADVLGPGEYLTSRQEGQRVEIAGNFVADDFVVITSRDDAGVKGYWVAAQFRLADASDPTSVAIAMGFTTDRAVAESFVGTPVEPGTIELTGRLFPDEGVGLPPHNDPFEMTSMSPAGLLGVWHDTESLHVYRAFILSDTALPGLEVISTSPPNADTVVSWINIFYAVEWIVFAGFALYLWYRLAKDAWEREVEDFEAASQEAHAAT